jgi:hypothetical protein
MRSAPIAVRPWLACLALGIAGPAGGWGCGPGENDQAPAPVNQEANKKSMEASGDFYRQKYQKKAAAPADAKGAAPAPK